MILSRLVYVYDDAAATLLRPKRRRYAYVALFDHFYIRSVFGLAARNKKNKKWDCALAD